MRTGAFPGRITARGIRWKSTRLSLWDTEQNLPSLGPMAAQIHRKVWFYTKHLSPTSMLSSRMRTTRLLSICFHGGHPPLGQMGVCLLARGEVCFLAREMNVGGGGGGCLPLNQFQLCSVKLRKMFDQPVNYKKWILINVQMWRETFFVIREKGDRVKVCSHCRANANFLCRWSHILVRRKH